MSTGVLPGRLINGYFTKGSDLPLVLILLAWSSHRARAPRMVVAWRSSSSHVPCACAPRPRARASHTLPLHTHAEPPHARGSRSRGKGSGKGSSSSSSSSSSRSTLPPARPRSRAFAAQPLGPAPRVTRPRCSGGSPESRSIRSGMASRLKSRQGSLIRERGSIEPGTAVANVLSDGDPLAVLCSFERKGCGSTLGQQELATVRSGLGVWERKSLHGSGSSAAVAAVQQ